jgi:hypothetical protein
VSNRAERPASTEEGASTGDSFVGGIGVAYPDSPLAKYRFTWPLARLTVAAEELRFSPRGPLKLLMKPVVIPFAEINSVEARVGSMIGTFVFHCRQRELDGISFGTLKLSGLNRLLTLLESKGIKLARRYQEGEPND